MISNFTVTTVTFPEFEGVDWTIDQPEVILQITPNPGYCVDANNFSATNPLPSYVASVTFTQNGANILVTIVYTAPSITPANDVFIEVCAQGYAEQCEVCVEGEVILNLTNTSNPIMADSPISYNGCNIYNQTDNVINLSVTPIAGYYFSDIPSLTLVIGDPNSYTGYDNPTTVLDGDGNIVQANFSVDYTYPLGSVTGDQFNLSAHAKEIWDPAAEIIAYGFLASPMSNGEYVTDANGSTVVFNVYGIEGAAWSLTYADSGGTTIATFSGTLDASGQDSVNVGFPSVVADEYYDFTLSGDLASTFCASLPCATGQSYTWRVNQYVETTLGFQFTSTDPAITVGAEDTQTFLPFAATSPQPYTYTVTATSTQAIVWNLDTQGNEIEPPLSAWSNQNVPSSTPPEYQMNVLSQNFVIDNVPATKTLTATLNVNVSLAGTPDMTSELNLDDWVQNSYTPVSLSFGATSDDACCNGTVGTYFITQGQTFASAGVLYANANGDPAADGYYVKF